MLILIYFNELQTNSINLNVVDMKFQGELRWKPVMGLELSALGAVKYNSSSQEHKIRESSNQAMAYRAMDDATMRDANNWLYTDPDVLNSLPFSVLPKGGFITRLIIVCSAMIFVHPPLGTRFLMMTIS